MFGLLFVNIVMIVHISHIGWTGSSSTDVHCSMVPVFVYIPTMLGYRPAYL